MLCKVHELQELILGVKAFLLYQLDWSTYGSEILPGTLKAVFTYMYVDAFVAFLIFK